MFPSGRQRYENGYAFDKYLEPVVHITPMFLTEFQEISGVIQPPPSVKPNFEHPDSIGYRIIIASVVCWASATPVVFLRLHTRRNVLHIIAFEDCKYSGGLRYRHMINQSKQIFSLSDGYAASDISSTKKVLMCPESDPVFSSFSCYNCL